MMKGFVSSFRHFALELSAHRLKGFEPPFIYCDSDGDILSWLQKFFTAYMAEVRKIDCIDNVNMMMKIFLERNSPQLQGSTAHLDLFDELDRVTYMLQDVIVQAFKGFPVMAYLAMEKELTADNCHLLQLMPQVIGRLRAYRVRPGRHTDRREMFHVPFECRTKCAASRYSIAGYPSLYLAGSLQTAMREIGAEKGQEYSAVYLRSTNSERTLLDVSLAFSADYFWEQYALVLFYPLIAACGMRVRTPADPFRPEYIIPQILMQVLRLHSNQIIGISYTSSRMATCSMPTHRDSNYVIFVRGAETESGWSQELADDLEMTDPVTFILDESAEQITAIERELCNKTFSKIAV